MSRSVRWAFVESLVSASASVLTILALARFLTPAEFGAAGLAVAVAAIVQAFLLGGMPDALVRAPSVHSRLLDAAFWAMLGLGVAAAALCGVAALFVAYALHQPELAALIAVQGLTGIAVGAAAAPTGRLLRKLRTRALVNRTLVARLVGLAAAVAAALAGWGAWAVIAGNLAQQFAAALQLLAAGRAPRLVRDPALSALLKLGLLSGTQASLGTLTTRGFLLAFGAAYGTAAVGLFSFALRLAEEGCGLIIQTLRRVTIGTFASARRAGLDTPALFKRGTGMIASIAAPLFLGAAAVAPEAVPLLFGARWTPAVPALQLMLLLWTIRSTRMLVNAIMVVDGRQKTMAAFGALGLAATALAFAASLPFGPAVSTLAYAATLVGVVFGGRQFARTTGIGPAAQLAAAARPILIALAMVALIYALRLGPFAALDTAPRLAALIAAGALAYAALAALFDRDSLKAIVRALRR